MPVVRENLTRAACQPTGSLLCPTLLQGTGSARDQSAARAVLIGRERVVSIDKVVKV